MTSDDGDIRAQQRLDQAARVEAPAGALDPHDDLALYALVYAALAEEEHHRAAPPIGRIERAIAAIESGRLHPFEVVLAAVLGVAALLVAIGPLAQAIERLGWQAGALFAPLAAATAFLLIAVADRQLGRW
jgi:hypothetical protein